MQTAYANDTTFSWNDKKSVTEVFKTLGHFSLFSGLKPNISKCEICGIGALKGVTKALRGMRCINLENDMVKICYNPLLLKNAKRKNTITENIKNWKTAKGVKDVTVICRREFSIFKTLAISKIVHLVLIKE